MTKRWPLFGSSDHEYCCLCTYLKSRVFKLKDLIGVALRSTLPCSGKLDASSGCSLLCPWFSLWNPHAYLAGAEGRGWGWASRVSTAPCAGDCPFLLGTQGGGSMCHVLGPGFSEVTYWCPCLSSTLTHRGNALLSYTRRHTSCTLNNLFPRNRPSNNTP